MPPMFYVLIFLAVILAIEGLSQIARTGQSDPGRVRDRLKALSPTQGGVKREDGTVTRKGLALAVDCNPLWCWLDPYAGSVAAVAEAARNVACTGARPLALTNCLNFGNPEKPEIMWEFAEATRGRRGRNLAASRTGRPGSARAEGRIRSGVPSQVGFPDDSSAAVVKPDTRD